MKKIQEPYTVFGVGGKNDGEEIMITNSLSDAVNKAVEYSNTFELGTLIIDKNGNDVEY